MDYTKKPFYLKPEDLKWVEDTLSGMTNEEKLNQVLMDMLWNPTEKELTRIVARGHGGYRYNNQDPQKTYKQNAIIQQKSKIPALIAANVESGGSGAVSGGTKLGEGIACAATGETDSAYYMGLYGCREAAAVGCNWTFAPVVDIDLNWRNCIIPTRCFGNDPDTVLQMTLAYMKGAHEAGVACCMKHFPGDGCDERDQHLATTVNTLSCEEWDATFGKVYQGMIDAGVPSIMIGHIMQPAYSRKLRPGIRDSEIMPATVAPELLKGLLRDKLGFNGLIVTDATHMVGITSKKPRRDFLPEMIMAGCDMILFSRDYTEDLSYLRRALSDGRLTEERLDEAVRTVLAFKASLGLHKKQKDGTLIPAQTGLSVIGCQEHKEKAAEIIDKSITLVKNSRDQLPLDPKKHKRVIIYTVQSSGLVAKVKEIAHGGKAGNVSDNLADALKAQGFEPTIYKVNYLKYVSPHGLNGKKALSDIAIEDYISTYDAAIVLCNVTSFSMTNERSLHWSIPMGPEIPWYASEIPTIGVSVAHPFHLLDLPMVPIYINTYNGSKEAMRQLVEKLTGKSAFKGSSPVDAFCGLWDTRL